MSRPSFSGFAGHTCWRRPWPRMRSTSGCLPARTSTAPEAQAQAIRRTACRGPKLPTETHRQIRVGEYHLVIAVRKVVRSLTTATPEWLLVLCGVCLAIPWARLAVLVFTAAWCLVPGAWCSPREPVVRRARGRAASRTGAAISRLLLSTCSPGSLDLRSAPANRLSGPGARAASRYSGARAWSDGPRRGPGPPPGQPPRGAEEEDCCRCSTRRRQVR